MLCYDGFNYINLYGNATDLYTIVEINVLLSVKSTNPVFLFYSLSFSFSSRFEAISGSFCRWGFPRKAKQSL